MDEGYIKFQPVWMEAPPLSAEKLGELDKFRQSLFEHHLIGVYPNGIGYGNISCRFNSGSNRFIISGSGTGRKEKLTTNDYALVTAVDIPGNRLYCEGPVIASSESMSHAVVYQSLDWVEAVIHVHHLVLWQKLLHKVPTTATSATFGTPEMAYSIQELLENTDLPQQQIFVMEGHEEGIFTFGKDLFSAYDILLQTLRSIEKNER